MRSVLDLKARMLIYRIDRKIRAGSVLNERMECVIFA